MTQTAVEKLIEQLTPILDRSKISDTMLHNLVEEYLAMEKKQIMNSWVRGVISENNVTAEEDYNKTYKQDYNDTKGKSKSII